MSKQLNRSVDYNQKVLEVKNLKKYFYVGVGKNKLTIPAVDNVSIDVYKREVFGLVGESGCGKTTTGRTIIKLYNPTDGTVDLNGIRIGAGYGGNIQNIQKIKKQAKEDILKLNPSKFRVYEIKSEANDKIEYIKQDIENLNLKLKNEMKYANEPINKYQADLYQLKSLFTLDIAKIQYEYTLNKHAVERQMENEMVREYKNEVAIQTTTYHHKLSGLKDSAALTKETIQKRIASLNEEHKQSLDNLKQKYQPLIEDAEKARLHKNEVNKKINELKRTKKEKTLNRKSQYQQDIKTCQAPDKSNIAKDILDLKAKHQREVKKLQEKIKQIQTETKEKINNLPKLDGTQEDVKGLKEKIDQIKLERKEKIRVEKDEIRNKKTINKSKEALAASRKMQMIFQDPISSLNPRMTVKEIVGEGLTILGGYSDDEIAEQVSKVLELVGLSADYAARYPHEFSGGQRQRIGIARALIMNPNFIIADEPISALDVSIRAQVINLLTDLREELGLTILFIAHDLSVVRFFCDRIAVMYYGKIVELAPSQELFAHPMHAYTRSLLSAIPQPDPDYEKGRKRINYDPSKHNYRTDKPSLREISPGHMVYANNEEFEILKKEYALIDKNKDTTEKTVVEEV